MENLIIYLAVFSILALIIALAGVYSRKNIIQKAFDQKAKELDAKDNTINSQKAELANRKDQIDAQRKLITKSTDELELVKAGLESCREDFEKLKADDKKLTTEIVELTDLKDALNLRITTLEEENQQLLTQLNTKKNAKRNPKN